MANKNRTLVQVAFALNSCLNSTLARLVTIMHRSISCAHQLSWPALRYAPDRADWRNLFFSIYAFILGPSPAHTLHFRDFDCRIRKLAESC